MPQDNKGNDYSYKSSGTNDQGTSVRFFDASCLLAPVAASLDVASREQST